MTWAYVSIPKLVDFGTAFAIKKAKMRNHLENQPPRSHKHTPKGQGLEFDMNITFFMILELLLHLRKIPLIILKVFIN